MNTETNYAEHFYADISNDTDALLKNVNDNPFSSVAQFLLLYHYKKNNDPSFEQYARQVAIYFNNIPWIEYQLSEINNGQFPQPLLSTEIKENDATVNEVASPADKEIVQNPFHENEVLTEDFSDKIQTLEEDEIKENTDSVNEEIIQNPIHENEASTEDFSDKIQTLGEDEIKENADSVNEPALSADREIIPNPVQENEELTEDFSNKIQTLGEDEIKESATTVNEQIIKNPIQENEELTEDFSDKIQTLGEDEIKENTDSVNEPALSADREIIQNPVHENEELTEDFSNKIQTLGEDEIKESATIVNEQIIPNPIQENEEATEDFSDKIQTLGEDEIKENAATPNEGIIQNPFQENENEEEPVAFEPLHTVDYFASQGIKISEEALENDHLGQQVKSFTAWLKSMKRLHPGQLPEQNEVIEKIIQSSAEVSNQNANVLTEAMAEVLIKQDKKQKAIEMYEKLSLMNPSKSTYFAAKIESLKTI